MNKTNKIQEIKDKMREETINNYTYVKVIYGSPYGNQTCEWN